MNFNEIFSLVVRHTSIQMLLAMVAHHDLELEQLNVKTTFIREELEEDILMSRPEGFALPGKEDKFADCKNPYIG